jgi:pectate lyase
MSRGLQLLIRHIARKMEIELGHRMQALTLLPTVALMTMLLSSGSGAEVTLSTAISPAALAAALVLDRGAAGCAAVNAVQVRDGRVTAAPLLDRIAGFAKVAGVTGGLDKAVFTVTTLTDTDARLKLSPPAGSLRAAVEAARKAGGGWITFGADLGPAPRIDLAAPLRLPSNITIDGGCSGIQITAFPDDTIFVVLAKAQNVVLTRMSLTKRGTTTPKSAGDCISVGQESDGVWIAYNALRTCGDGMIDITQSGPSERPTRVTVAFNHLADHDKSMIAGTLDCAYRDRAPDWCGAPLEARAWSWSSGVQVTLQGNVFVGTGQRHPRVGGRAYVHVIDNVIAIRPYQRSTGGEGASYGTYVGGGGRVFIEHSLYVSLGPTVAAFDAVRPARAAAFAKTNEGPGAARLSQVVVQANGRAADENPAAVMDPPYVLKAARSFASNPVDAARCAALGVGPGAATRVPSQACAAVAGGR